MAQVTIVYWRDIPAQVIVGMAVIEQARHDAEGDFYGTFEFP